MRPDEAEIDMAPVAGGTVGLGYIAGPLQVTPKRIVARQTMLSAPQRSRRRTSTAGPTDNEAVGAPGQHRLPIDGRPQTPPPASPVPPYAASGGLLAE